MRKSYRAKKLGQVFLVNERIARKQVEYANINENDIVLEIGAGKGVLTKYLIKRAGKVIAIEKDKLLAEYLKRRFRDVDNLKIVCGDALEIDFPEFNKVVSNIPYTISSKLLFKILNYNFELGVLMFQKEFAEKMIAKPGMPNYGRLSVKFSMLAEGKILRVVHPQNFRPVPKVFSAIVLIKPKSEKIIDEGFSKFVDKIFCYRKKTLKNAFKAAYRIPLSLDDEILHRKVYSLSIEDLRSVYEKVKIYIEGKRNYNHHEN